MTTLAFAMVLAPLAVVMYGTAAYGIYSGLRTRDATAIVAGALLLCMSIGITLAVLASPPSLTACR